MKRKPLSLLTVAMTAFVALALALGLAACGGETDEQKVTSLVQTQIDSAGSLDKSGLKDAMGDAYGTLKDGDVDPNDVWDEITSGATVEIKTVTVDGDSADIELDCTALDVAGDAITVNDSGKVKVDKDVDDTTYTVTVTAKKDSDGEWAMSSDFSLADLYVEGGQATLDAAAGNIVAPQQIRALVDKEYSGVTDITDAQLQAGLGSTYTELQQYGVDPKAYWDALFSRFSYTIDDVTVDGDTGTVTLTVDNIDITTGLNNWRDAVNAYASSDQAQSDYASGGEDAVMKYAMGLLVTSLGADDLAVVENQVTLDVIRDSSGNWDFADSDAVFSAAFGGVNPSEVIANL